MPRPTNALIVDDEAHVRTFLRLVLKELGIENIWEARDGAQALAQASLHKPELVLLDLNLPILAGTEVLEQLQRLQPGVPVVIVTSQNAMKTVMDTVRLGAVGYILKQSPKVELEKSLGQILERIESGEVEGDSDSA